MKIVENNEGLSTEDSQLHFIQIKLNRRVPEPSAKCAGLRLLPEQLLSLYLADI